MCDINITQYGDSCDPGIEECGEGGEAEQGRGANTAAANTLLGTMIQSLTYSHSGARVSHRARQDAAVQDLLSLELVSLMATELSPPLPTSQQQVSVAQYSTVRSNQLVAGS